MISENIKRFLDIIGSTLAIFIFLPVFLITTAFIRLDSKGPVLFRQRRVGKGERTFYIYKFRTMIDRDADQIDQLNEQVVSSSNDPRITRVGRILRDTSLDELPQLFNIFIGDMSIVGPRPILPDQLAAVPPKYRQRANVSPGLTGLAQIRGRRNLDWLIQLAFDYEYVIKQNTLFDIQIILTTVWQVLRRKGVYGSPGMNWRGYLSKLDGEQPRDEDVTRALQTKRLVEEEK